MMSDMKRYGYLLLVLILIVSCSSNVFRGEERIGEGFISVESKGFDGEKSYRIEVDSDTYASMDLRVEEGVLSIIVENGKIKCGFTPSIMTTNIFELFSNIQEIGNEIDFTRLSSASPELLIKNISIAGKKK